MAGDSESESRGAGGSESKSPAPPKLYRSPAWVNKKAYAIMAVPKSNEGEEPFNYNGVPCPKGGKFLVRLEKKMQMEGAGGSVAALAAFVPPDWGVTGLGMASASKPRMEKLARSIFTSAQVEGLVCNERWLSPVEFEDGTSPAEAANILADGVVLSEIAVKAADSITKNTEKISVTSARTASLVANAVEEQLAKRQKRRESSPPRQDKEEEAAESGDRSIFSGNSGKVLPGYKGAVSAAKKVADKVGSKVDKEASLAEARTSQLYSQTQDTYAGFGDFMWMQEAGHETLLKEARDSFMRCHFGGNSAINTTAIAFLDTLRKYLPLAQQGGAAIFSGPLFTFAVLHDLAVRLLLIKPQNREMAAPEPASLQELYQLEYTKKYEILSRTESERLMSVLQFEISKDPGIYTDTFGIAIRKFEEGFRNFESTAKDKYKSLADVAVKNDPRFHGLKKSAEGGAGPSSSPSPQGKGSEATPTKATRAVTHPGSWYKSGTATPAGPNGSWSLQQIVAHLNSGDNYKLPQDVAKSQDFIDHAIEVVSKKLRGQSQASTAKAARAKAQPSTAVSEQERAPTSHTAGAATMQARQSHPRKPAAPTATPQGPGAAAAATRGRATGPSERGAPGQPYLRDETNPTARPQGPGAAAAVAEGSSASRSTAASKQGRAPTNLSAGAAARQARQPRPGEPAATAARPQRPGAPAAAPKGHTAPVARPQGPGASTAAAEEPNEQQSLEAEMADMGAATDAALEGQREADQDEAAVARRGRHQPLGTAQPPVREQPHGPKTKPKHAEFIGSAPEAVASVKKLLDEYADEVDRIYSGPPDTTPISKEEIDEWVKELREECYDDTEFQAGSWSRSSEVWLAVFEWAMTREGRQKIRRAEKRVHSFLKTGYDFLRDASPIIDREGEGQPDWEKKLKRVTKALRRQEARGELPKGETARMLAEAQPPRHEARNYSTAETEEGRKLLTDEHYKNVETGATTEWDQCPIEVTNGEEKPWMVSSLGLHYHERKEKYRQIYGALLFNLWQKYTKQRFETIQELAALASTASEDDAASTADFKSGYYHVLAHLRSRKYLGYYIRDYYTGRHIYAVYNVLPFGVQRAVITYTQCVAVIENIRRRHFRAVGITMIDDRASLYRSIREGLVLERFTYRLYILLGSYFSLPKIDPVPSRLFVMLGFQLCLDSRRLIIPRDKVVYMRKKGNQLMKAASLTNRDLASLAGLLVSVYPACKLAPPLARAMFDVVKQRPGWREWFDNDDHLVDVVRTVIDDIDQWNGASFVSYPQGVMIGGDASEIGIGGGIHDTAGHPSDTEDLKVTYSFSPEQLHRIRSNEFSSTLGEVLGCGEVLAVAVEQLPQRTKGKQVTYVTDSVNAARDITKGRSPSNPEITAEIKKIILFCLQHGVELKMAWRRRNEIQLWDDRSKEFDRSEWGLEHASAESTWTTLLELEPGVSEPICDAFGNSGAWHRLARFISKNHARGAWGRNAYVCGPRLQALQLELGGPIYVNGPFDEMASIVAWLCEYRLDAIVIYPDWGAPWRGLLESLPRGHPRILELAPRPGLCFASGRVRGETASGSPPIASIKPNGAPAWPLRAVYIKWPL